MSKKAIFYLLWFFLLVLGPITVIRNTPPYFLAEPSGLLNFLQRIIGLMAFTLLFIQIILGSLMEKLVEKLGGWIFKFHITEGIVAYGLILVHPLLLKFDPLYVFLGFSSQGAEFYYSFGRSAFWLLTVGVAAGLLRTQPWLQNNWRKFHVLNYVAFFLVWYHSFKVGTDIGTFPFSFFHGPSLVVVSAIVLYKLYVYLRLRFFSVSHSNPIPTRRVE